MTDKGKILVVDDDRLVLATLTHGLLQAGYEVIDTDNGDDAILLAREHRPDLPKQSRQLRRALLLPHTKPGAENARG